MAYNPDIHHRRSIRLKGYDYSREGAYFITICCHNKICRFGEITDQVIGEDNNIGSQMTLNEYGWVAYNEWAKIPDRFSDVELDVFQIMPNHMHGIIILKNPVKAKSAQNVEKTEAKNPALGDIVGAYKSLVANECLAVFKNKINDGAISQNETMGKLWLRNYYENIIRDEKSYEIICNYIINNPAKWLQDIYYHR